MQFQSWDLGSGRRGAIVTFTLKGSAANCLLLDSSNFQSFKNGRSYRGVGGAVTRSPFQAQIPDNGRWYAVVFLGAYRGPVTPSISVRDAPKNLPPAQSIPASRTPSAPTGPSPLREVLREPPPSTIADGPVFDVFISHASEDKAAVARPLRDLLEDAGLKVWLDETQMRIGSSLRQSIDKGIVRSRFAVVVLSPDFISKGWTNYELDGVVTQSVGGKQVILPIWHRISHDEVAAFSPSLADRLARDTALIPIEDIAAEIVGVVSEVPPT